jgi:Domain of unknown function (DUF4259)
MGAWSKDSFGNDTACDWAYSLEETNDLGLVRETIKKVLDVDKKYLEVQDAEEAIAAIEIIACLRGNFGERNSYTKAINDWVKAHPQHPPVDLMALTSRAQGHLTASCSHHQSF